MWGACAFPNRDATDSWLTDKPWDAHLRSTREVGHYRIESTDGLIGHIEDFVIDDETWTIRYLIVNLGTLLEGKKVLLAPSWTQRVNWPEGKIYVDLTKLAIQMSPEYSEAALLTREHETGLHQHFNRQGYWIDESEAKAKATHTSK